MDSPEQIVKRILSDMSDGVGTLERRAIRSALRIGCAAVLALTEIRDELADIRDELQELRLR